VTRIWIFIATFVLSFSTTLMVGTASPTPALAGVTAFFDPFHVFTTRMSKREQIRKDKILLNALDLSIIGIPSSKT
jgi:hypothetical protein